MNKPNHASGCIVCTHVAHGEHQLRLAIRGRPSVPEDSGWQFLCASGEEENSSTAEIWRLDEVAEICPSIAQILAKPIGSAWELGESDKWVEADL
jgi:hypothetical protein